MELHIDYQDETMLAVTLFIQLVKNHLNDTHICQINRHY